MARAIWSGSISFGLLNVPVKLYSAVARRGISLREIRESDGVRIRHRRVAEGTDEEVPFEKIVKAYEIAKDRYIPLAKSELEALAPEKSRAIEVKDFVDLEEIDPIYFDSPYYLGPAEGAERAYSLLARAMEGSGKVAIARFVFRNKEHLAAVRPSEGVLTLTTMRFADEVVHPPVVGVAAGLGAQDRDAGVGCSVPFGVEPLGVFVEKGVAGEVRGSAGVPFV